MKWHHIITKTPTCLFGQATGNYVKHPLAKLTQKSDGSWDWIVFGGNLSGNEPDRTSARVASDRVIKKKLSEKIDLYFSDLSDAQLKIDLEKAGYEFYKNIDIKLF